MEMFVAANMIQLGFCELEGLVDNTTSFMVTNNLLKSLIYIYFWLTHDELL